jgi:flavin-dependent dehydrogenase
MVKTTDVFVIGGGPAGLAVAIAARQHGLEVVVADGTRPPIDKPCGEGLMPDGRAALQNLGVSIPAEVAHPFRGIRFVSGDVSVDANFPNGNGIGLRRTTLHRVMVARAEAVGVSLLWQTPVSGLHPEGVLLGKNVMRSRWVVGADGGHSLVRQWAGLDRYRYDRTRFAFRRHYRVSPWSDCMELHWGPGCQIYVTPVAADEVCVALISRDPHLRLDAALAAFPQLVSALRGAEASSTERGAISSTRKFPRVYRGCVALVGDASGTVDAITGEGLCRQLARRPALMARLMLTLDWKTSFRQRVMRAFAFDPRLFGRMLATHVGTLSPADLATNGISLGWRALCA